MRNRYDLFGGLPDTIKDDWIDDIETLGEKMDRYLEERRQATGFDLRYNDGIKPGDDAWRDCSAVLARRDRYTPRGLFYDLEPPRPGVSWSVKTGSVIPINGVTRVEEYNLMTGETRSSA